MNKYSICPHGNDCLLLKTYADRECEICNSCRAGRPEEFALHVMYIGGLSKILRFADLPLTNLDTTIREVTIYRLDGKKYYSKEVDSFQPESKEKKQAVFAEVKSWANSPEYKAGLHP